MAIVFPQLTQVIPLEQFAVAPSDAICAFGSLGVTIGTNVVSLTLNDLNSDVSTNHTQIIVAGGEAAGEIAEAIINGLKKIP